MSWKSKMGIEDYYVVSPEVDIKLMKVGFKQDLLESEYGSFKEEKLKEFVPSLTLSHQNPITNVVQTIWLNDKQLYIERSQSGNNYDSHDFVEFEEVPDADELDAILNKLVK